MPFPHPPFFPLFFFARKEFLFRFCQWEGTLLWQEGGREGGAEAAICPSNNHPFSFFFWLFFSDAQTSPPPHRVFCRFLLLLGWHNYDSGLHSWKMLSICHSFFTAARFQIPAYVLVYRTYNIFFFVPWPLVLELRRKYYLKYVLSDLGENRKKQKPRTTKSFFFSSGWFPMQDFFCIILRERATGTLFPPHQNA